MSIPSLAPLAAAAGEGRRFTAPMGKAAWLRCVWLSDAATPSDAIAFPLLSALSVTPSVSGEVRTFAGGVDIAFSKVGRRSAVKVSLPSCSRAHVAWLESHIGRTVCVRDDRGRRLFGVYWSVPTAEHRYNVEADVDLDIATVTVAEAV